MKEQIEEIARAICGLNTSDGCFCDGGYCNYNCLSYGKAEALYNAGYRKQIEGEWKPIMAICNRVECNKCGEMGVLRWKYCPNCGAKMKGA